jgi:hypothetical protein
VGYAAVRLRKSQPSSARRISSWKRAHVARGGTEAATFVVLRRCASSVSSTNRSIRRSATQIRMRSPVLTKARGPPDAASGVTCGTMVPCCLLSSEHIEFRFAPKSRRLAEIPSRSFGANAETMRSPRITSTWRGLEPLAMALGLTPAHVDRGNRGPVRRSRQLLWDCIGTPHADRSRLP